MTAGFQAFSDSGVFQIDGLTPNYQLVQSMSGVSQRTRVPTVWNDGHGRQFYGEYWICSFTFAADEPLYAFHADPGIGVALWDAGALDGNGRQFTVRLITTQQAMVRFFVFSKVPASSSNFGLQVFDERGSLIADATSPFYRVLDVIQENYMGDDLGWVVAGAPNPPDRSKSYGRPVLISALWSAHYIWGSSNSNQLLWDILEIGTVSVSGDAVTWGTRVFNGGRTPNVTTFRECWRTRFMVLDGTGIV
ncbi:hypothetical protein [Burkholderia sp. F1]|uniref:hypothetical protein n=1 Tax=Burkholderia sp. F1 TaxID=3366817 RepID=UPI003D735F84